MREELQQPSQMAKEFLKPLILSLIINFFLFLYLSEVTYFKFFEAAKIISIDFISFAKSGGGMGGSRKPSLLPSSRSTASKGTVAPAAPAITDTTNTNKTDKNMIKHPQDGQAAVGGGEGGPEGGGYAILDASELGSPLKILYMAKPEYPEELRLLNKEEKITVRFLVNESGSVEKVEVPEKEKSPLFASAAADAVGKWRFAPPMLDGKHIKVWFTTAINFKLE
jgi:TonB family protein